jgi:hypothetical protein
MRHVFLLASPLVLILVACGGDDTSGGGGSGGSGAGAGAGSSSGGNGAGGHPKPPPVANTCTPPATAADVSKPTTVVGSGAASSCTEAKLDAAIAKGGVITFDCGTAKAKISLTSAKTIAKDTVIDGGNTVTLDAGKKQRIFVTAGDISFTVQNITLANGIAGGPRANGPSADNSGGAIYRQSNGKTTVVHVTFNDNDATQMGPDVGGGAVFSYGGDTVIVGSTFSGNTGSNGGAIGNLRSNLTIVNSVFSANTATDGNGGAMYTDGQNADHGKVFTLCGVIMKDNRAHMEAGAVYRYGYPGESSVIDSSTFDSNTAEDMMGGLGGGLYIQTDTVGAMPLTMTNSTISNNTAGRGAGGMFVYNCPSTITNVTVANNKALTSLGGGLSMNGVPGTFTNVTIAGNQANHPDSFAGGLTGTSAIKLVNSIIANNTAGNGYNPVSCTDPFASGDHDLQWPAKEGAGGADKACVNGINFADPKLGPLMDNGGPTETMELGAGSPEFGAGANCPATDQRGTKRSGACDLGAVQHGS